jgi:hypothetical protein
MDNKQVHVHNEEAIIESVLSGKSSGALPGVAECPECTDLVKDVRKLAHGLSSIEDEDPPPLNLNETLKKKPQPLLTPWIQDLPSNWYRNPFVLSFGFVMFVLLVYILVAFVFR